MSLAISIDAQRCTLCGYCVDACPVSIFRFDESESAVLVDGVDQCLVCRNCEEHCRPRCLSVDFPEWPHRSSSRRRVIEPEAPPDPAAEGAR